MTAVASGGGNAFSILQGRVCPIFRPGQTHKPHPKNRPGAHTGGGAGTLTRKHKAHLYIEGCGISGAIAAPPGIAR